MDEDQRSSMSDLSPPRPFFAAQSQSERNSWTSQDSVTTNDPPSTTASDSESSAPTPATSHPKPQLLPPNRSPRHTRSATAGTHKRRTTFMLPQDPDSAPPSENGHGVAPSPYQPPPSAFAFSFQAYPGNPDPGMHIPSIGRTSRRASWDSLSRSAQSPASPNQAINHTGSLTDLHRPYAPFMAGSSGSAGPSIPQSPSSNSLYRQSAASAAASSANVPLPRSSSTHSFRAPFLSPASRPSSSVWTPPVPNVPLPYGAIGSVPASPSASTAVLGLPKTSRPILPSTRLAQKLDNSEKPWLSKKEPRAATAWWFTLVCFALGAIVSAFVCYMGVSSVVKLSDSQLCPVLNEQFNGGSIDTDNSWMQEVELSGFE